MNREIRIWASNAGSFSAKIGGVDVELGRAGEVVSKAVNWARDEAGKYQLRVVAVN